MKVRVEFDLTPEEARQVLGLPDVAPMQKAMLDDVEARLKKAIALMEPEALLKTWLPLGAQGFEQFQRMVWGAAETAAGSRSRRGAKGEPDASR